MIMLRKGVEEPVVRTEHQPAGHEETEKKMRKRMTLAPDCSWSWMVAVSCAMMNFFSVVMIRSAGIIYVQIVDYFGVTREEAAWPLSIVPGVANLIGPLVAMLIRRVGVRTVAITGTFLSGVSVIASYFARDVLTLSITLGLCHGIGLGMTLTPNAVCLNQWFDKKKVRAAGIIYTGATAGSFTFLVLIKYFSETFGFSGCFLVIGALMLHGTVFALFLRSPPWMRKSAVSKSKTSSTPAPVRTFDIQKNKRKDKTVLQTQSMSQSCCRQHNSVVNYEKPKSGIMGCAATCSNLKREQRHHQGIGQRIGYEDSKTGRPNHIHCISEGIPGMSGTIKSSGGEQCAKIPSQVINQSQFKPVMRRDGFVDKLLCGAKLSKMYASVSSALSRTCTYVPAAYADTCNADVTLIAFNTISEGKQDSRCSPDSISRDQHERQANNTLLNPMYVMVCLSYIFVTNSNMAFMTVIMDFAHDREVPLQNAIYLLSGYAICDVTGRLTVGWVTDKGLLSRKATMAISCLTLGISFLVLPFFTTFEGILIVCLILGYSLGNTVVLFSVLLGDSVVLEKIAMAMGFMTFFSGICGFTRPSLIGYFRDQFGSYDNMLRLLGAIIVCLGMGWTVLRLLENSRNKQFDILNKEKTPERQPGVYIIPHDSEHNA
ncbi:monocarboxylate transporter 9-like [Ornithodoros turicata]|uniref:monocarboxylate transporter 9-like n=1 Tax=Ornithodoros turicata TaxID=34597 RepID=UPI00313940B2